MIDKDPLSHHDEALAASLLPTIRRALQLREIDEARATFLKLPSLEPRHEKWLEAVLRDSYTAGLFDVNAVLSFLESLPNWHWTLDGCCVLHRINVALESSSVHVVHVPTLPLAYFLHKLMSQFDGSVKIRAESYWFDWVSPTMRAVVTGKPLQIQSFLTNDVLYAPNSNFAFDFDRRNVFTWRKPWVPDDRKDHWRLIPATAKRDRFFLQSVQFDEYLYAADYAKFRRDARGNLRSRVFGWRKKGDDVGEPGHWQLVRVDPHNRDVFALFNPYQKEYLYAPPHDVYDSERRHVFTAVHCPQDVAWHEERKWRITPVALSSMEKGVEAFYMKQYPQAVELLTRALDHELPDHTEHVKCFVYRMAANVRMAKTEDLLEDFERIQQVGGDKAAIFHGLHHLWSEAAAVLKQRPPPPPDSHGDRDSAVGHPLRLAPLDHEIQCGDMLFVTKDYRGALDIYHEAALRRLQTQDKSLKKLQANASLKSAKCLYAMQQPERALQVLSKMLPDDVDHDGKEDDTSSSLLSIEMEARVRLWMGRCHRQQKRFDQALRDLERALDTLAPACDNSNLWVRQCILVEMQVVGIHQRELLDDLLTRSELAASHLPPGSGAAPRAATKTVQHMVDLFQCPLSLEFMQDPVMTPNGDTYERSMIEHHLDVNGAFDPLTRAALDKSQLAPNRALKLLMETLLSDHKLGLLLTLCGAS